MDVEPWVWLNTNVPGSRMVTFPIPSIMDHPLRSIVVEPVFNSSIHSPSGKAEPSELLFERISANSIGDGVFAITSKWSGLAAFGVGYAA